MVSHLLKKQKLHDDDTENSLWLGPPPYAAPKLPDDIAGYNALQIICSINYFRPEALENAGRFFITCVSQLVIIDFESKTNRVLRQKYTNFFSFWEFDDEFLPLAALFPGSAGDQLWIILTLLKFRFGFQFWL